MGCQATGGVGEIRTAGIGPGVTRNDRTGAWMPDGALSHHGGRAGWRGHGRGRCGRCGSTRCVEEGVDGRGVGGGEGLVGELFAPDEVDRAKGAADDRELGRRDREVADTQAEE